MFAFYRRQLRGRGMLLARYFAFTAIAAFLGYLEYLTLGKALDQLVALENPINKLIEYAEHVCIFHFFVWLLKRDASRLSVQVSGHMRMQLLDFVAEKRKICALEDGSFLRVLTSDTKKVGEMLEWTGTVFLPGIVGGIVTLVFALTVSWKLMLCFIVGFPLLVWFMKMLSERLKQVVSGLETEIVHYEMKIQQDIRFYEEWIAQGLSDKAQTDNLTELISLDKKKRKATIFRKMVWFITNTQEQYFRIIIYIFGGYLIMRGEISIGMLLTFSIYSDTIKRLFSLLFEIIPKWKETSDTCRLLRAQADALFEDDEGEEART